jgi:protocatechuate 3,4-dioxygenase beta subunit
MRGSEKEMTGEGRGRGITRRQSLGVAGTAGAGLFLGGLTGKLPLPDLGGKESLAQAAKTCIRLNPEQEEGPFYVDLGKVRSNVTEGQEGVPLTLRIRVIDHTKCEPLANAAVDIWQCNASGIYSDEESEDTLGQTYLRGIQFTDADGWAELKSIHPGHYEGRATHVHVRVHIGGKRTKKTFKGGHLCHTGQMFFPEAINDVVYAVSPYSSETATRVPNASDRVYTAQGGKYSLAKVKGSIASGLEATVTMGVDPSASPAAVGGASEGGGAPGGGAPPGAP